MDNQAGARSTLVYVVLFILAAVVTTAVLFLLVSSDQRNDKFWLTLSSLILAEAIGSGGAITLALRREEKQPSFPFNLGTGVMVGAYVAGVVVLALIATSTITFSGLLVLHLLWFLLFALGIGAAVIGGHYVGNLTTELKQQRATHMVYKEQLACVVDKLKLLEHKGAQPLREALEKVQEEARYATSESLPGSEAVDGELARMLGEIELRIEELAGLCSSAPAGEETPTNISEAVSALVMQVRLLGQALERRERLMGQLR